jgi:hypothetical protein
VEASGGSGHWVSLGGRAWHIETIWRAALGLPVEEVRIDAIGEIDEDLPIDPDPDWLLPEPTSGSG